MNSLPWEMSLMWKKLCLHLFKSSFCFFGFSHVAPGGEDPVITVCHICLRGWAYMVMRQYSIPESYQDTWVKVTTNISQKLRSFLSAKIIASYGKEKNSAWKYGGGNLFHGAPLWYFGGQDGNVPQSSGLDSDCYLDLKIPGHLQGGLVPLKHWFPLFS